MKSSKVVIIGVLIGIFVLVAGFRISLAFQQPEFAYEAYDVLRQVESIQQTGLPLFHDALSYGGRDRIIAPLYYYVLAILGFIIPKLFLVKVVPNLFAASIIFPVYHLTRYIADKKSFALLAAFLAGFVPASLFIGINDASPITLAIPLLFLAGYLFLKSKKRGKHLNWLIVVLIAFPFCSFLSIIFLLALLFYIIILQLERVKLTGKETEVFLFFLFFTGWVSHMLLKKAFIIHGTNIIWQNTPISELSKEFSRITLIEAISSTGLIPLALGAIGVYIGLSRSRKKSLMFLTSIILATIIPLWFKMIPLSIGLYILSITLVIASGYAFMQLWEQVKKTKFAKFNVVILISILFLFFIISLPTGFVGFQKNTPSSADVELLEWSKGSLSNATIFSTLEEGSAVAYLSGQKNVMDSDYLLVPQINERYDDINKVYSAFFKIDAISGMEKYGATHLLYSHSAQALTGNERPKYVVDEQQCFKLIKIVEHEDSISRLYELDCSLREGNK